MVTRRSNRTRGTKRDKYRPDLRARQISGVASQPVRGARDRLSVSIELLTQIGYCEYDPPTTTQCIATTEVDAVISGAVVLPVAYLWSCEDPRVTIVSPASRTTEVTTDSSESITFTLICTVTDSDDKVASDSIEITHQHIDINDLGYRVTQTGDDRVTQAGDRRIVNG